MPSPAEADLAGCFDVSSEGDEEEPVLGGLQEVIAWISASGRRFKPAPFFAAALNPWQVIMLVLLLVKA